MIDGDRDREGANEAGICIVGRPVAGVGMSLRVAVIGVGSLGKPSRPDTVLSCRRRVVAVVDTTARPRAEEIAAANGTARCSMPAISSATPTP